MAFAVPANARGLKLLASPYGAPRPRPFESPITAAHKMMETLTVFEDVLVPHERVFLKGEWKYAETLRALIRQAALECRVVPPGLAVPSPLLVNNAKHHFASGYAQAVAWVQEIAGGLLVTGPGQEDWESPETRPYLERYFGGAKGVPAEHRLRLMNLIQDLTASDFGGYQAVLAIHAEGSIEAEKLVTFRAYNPKPAVAYAKRLASIPAA